MSHSATSSNRSDSSDRYGRCMTCEISPQPITPIRIRPAAIRALWCSELMDQLTCTVCGRPAQPTQWRCECGGPLDLPDIPAAAMRDLPPPTVRDPGCGATATASRWPGDRDLAVARRGHDAADRRRRGAARRLDQGRLPVPDAVVQGPGSGRCWSPRRCSGTPTRWWRTRAATRAARSPRTRRERAFPAPCSCPSAPRPASSARSAPMAPRWNSCRATARPPPRRRSRP